MSRRPSECGSRTSLSWLIVVLCCAVLCCAVLCCAVLCCAVLCCAVLCCAVFALPGFRGGGDSGSDDETTDMGRMLTDVGVGTVVERGAVKRLAAMLLESKKSKKG